MKVLAVDLGTRSIKVLLLESTLRAVEIASFDEKELPLSMEPLPPGEMGRLLSELIHEKKYEADIVVSSISGEEASHKLIELPFKEKKKIDQTLAFEIEDRIPFSLEDVVVDYFLASAEGPVAQILTTHILKQNLKNFIDTLKIASLDPDIITTPPHALYYLSLIRPIIPVRAAAIVDIGHRKSSLSLIKDGALLAARTIPSGGSDITKAIGEHYRLSFEEAEQVKIERGFVLGESPGEVSKEQLHFSDVIKGALAHLVREVNQTLLAFRAKTRHSIDVVYLSGGTTMLRNLFTYFSEEWHAKIQPLRIFQHYPPGVAVQMNVLTEAKVAVSLGSALGALSQARPYRLNLRKGEFASAKARGAVFSKYRSIFLAGVLITLLFVADILAKSYFIRSEQEKFELRLRGAVLQVFPNTPQNVLSDAKKLKALVQGQLKEQELLIKEAGPIAAPKVRSVEILKGVSESLPSLKINVEEFSFAQKKVQIKGLSQSLELIDQYAANLTKIRFFKNVTKGEVTTAADEISKIYTLTLEAAE